MQKVLFIVLFSLLSQFSVGQKIDSLQNIKNKLEHRLKVFQDSTKKNEKAIQDSILKVESEINYYFLNNKLVQSNLNEKIFEQTIMTDFAFIYELPDFSSKNIGTKRKGDSILIEDFVLGKYEDRYAKLVNSGYIKSSYIKFTDKMYIIDSFLINRKKIQDYSDAERQLKNFKAIQINRRNELVKKYGKDAANKIFKGLIWLGMTKAMFLEIMDKPKDINRTAGTFGIHEQWVYDNGEYYYFENGKLTSWQD